MTPEWSLRVSKRDGPDGAVVLSVFWSTGRVYRTVVPRGGWRRYAATPEEWIQGIAGIYVTRGIYT